MFFHKNTAKISLFFILALFPVLLPVFTVSRASPFVKWDFPFQGLILAVFALVLITANLELYKSENEDSPEEDSKKVLRKKLIFLLYAVCTFVLLNVTAFIMQKTGDLMNYISHVSENEKIEILKPADFKAWIFCILNFLFSSFYEESVYRFFLPEAMIYFTRNCKDKRMAEIDCEILGMILFALGHIYLGILSVINAAIAYVILRICFKKTRSLVPGTAAHFFYNLLQLIVSPL